MAVLRDPYRGDDPPSDEVPWWAARLPAASKREEKETTMAPKVTTETMRYYTARDTLARVKRAVEGLPEDQRCEVFEALSRCMADIRNDVTLAHAIIATDLEKLREAESVSDWRAWCERVAEAAGAKHGLENASNICKILAGEEPDDHG